MSRQGVSRQTDEPEGEMILYGRNPVREALRGSRTVAHVWATTGAAREPWLRGAPVSSARADEIAALCGSEDHQGICAEVSPFVYASEDAILAGPPGLLVVLDQVQDPQNLGAICRTAECAGARAIVIPERRAAEVTPAVCKASAGAVEHITVARVRNVADFLAAAKVAGRWCYGADGAAHRLYTDIAWDDQTVLVLGAEGTGLRPRVASACDDLVAIPLRGRIESLSVSAAAAVLLYAATAR